MGVMQGLPRPKNPEIFNADPKSSSRAKEVPLGAAKPQGRDRGLTVERLEGVGGFVRVLGFGNSGLGFRVQARSLRAEAVNFGGLKIIEG